MSRPAGKSQELPARGDIPDIDPGLTVEILDRRGDAGAVGSDRAIVVDLLRMMCRLGPGLPVTGTSNWAITRSGPRPRAGAFPASFGDSELEGSAVGPECDGSVAPDGR